MKHVRTAKVVTLEDHAVTVSLRELAELLVADDPSEHVDIDPRRLSIQVVVDDSNAEGRRTPFPASVLLDLIRANNAEIPEDAEVVLAVRWRKEVEPNHPSQSAAVMAAPGGAGGMGMIQAAAAAVGADPNLAAFCQGCGAVPVFQGPTPDCHDPGGCGAVRQRYGQMPIPVSQPPQQGPWMTPGQAPMMVPQAAPPANPAAALRIPKGKAYNPQTGEVAFLDRDGQPYGKGDYVKDRISMRDI